MAGLGFGRFSYTMPRDYNVALSTSQMLPNEDARVSRLRRLCV